MTRSALQHSQTSKFMSPATEPFPSPTPSARSRALARLRRAIEDESQRRLMRRIRRRWVIAGIATLFVVGISPTGPDGLSSPLIGLADAVAAAPMQVESPGRHWYSKSESRELVSIPIDVDGEKTLEFLVVAVEETWHDAGDTPRRTVTYGAPRFFSPEDEDAFHAAGLGSRYQDGLQVDAPLTPDEYRFATVVSRSDPEVLESTLRSRVAGLGDQRMEEVRLLRLTAELIQLHADDPALRSRILRVVADIPGIVVIANTRNVVVSIDYLDGDRPLRLMYEFDAETAHLVGEYLAALATHTEPATVLRSARHSIPNLVGVLDS